MPDTATPTAAPPRGALRLVLFGMPAAGKTSLLGALAQAAQTQEHLLHGHLADPSHGLAELQHRLYDETPRRTAEEVVPYAVDFEPFPEDGPPAPAGHLGAVLIDCDGRVANDLLLRRRSVPEDSPEGTLAGEVLAADALLLVVDASAPPTQVDADFAEFGRFLRLLEQGRGARSEVGGLPVFLVLTKCDLLARPADVAADWAERIEERKRLVGARFRDFLGRRDAADGPPPFGRIDLHLAATAVKRPALAGQPERPREPYGVAELFRQALEAADAFRRRRVRSTRRLVWTVGGAVGLAAVMAGLAVALFTGHREGGPSRLQMEVERYRSTEGQTAAERLSGSVPQLEKSIAVLTELHSDPQFAALPADTQQYLTERLEEKKAYLDYLKHLQRGTSPAEARSEQELRRIEDTLKALGPEGLALPRPEWAQTPAGRLHADRLEDVKALRAAVDDVEQSYQNRKREGEKLWAFADRQPGAEASVNWRAWHEDAARFLSATARPPSPETARIPGAASPELTYQTAYRFAAVEEARADLGRVRKRLEAVRDLSAALGLGGPPGQAVLVIPNGVSAEDAAKRLQELRKTFPNYEKEFTLPGLPDAARGDVRQAARTSYAPLLEAGRPVILRHLQEASPGGPETPKTWQAIRPWLADPPELASWRVLARLLVQLSEPDRPEPDPVAELATFLGRDRFDLNLRGLTLELPDALKVRPDGELTVYHRPAQGAEAALAFRLGDRQHDANRGVSSYPLRARNGSALTYRPGDSLFAVLPVRDADNREMALTWAGGRSLVYQFERLLKPPRLHRRDLEHLKGSVAEGVALMPGSPDAIPRLPDLVPFVKFDRAK